jgi:orotate phosphoribosyltransferase-like protein
MPQKKEEQIYTEQYAKFLTKKALSNLEVEEEKTGDVGDAIIVAGIGDEPSNTLFIPTQILSSTMYNTMKLRGFSDKDIYFINANNEDSKEYKLSEIVDDTNASVKTLLNKIKNISKNGKKGPLYIYLVDHGAV